MSDFCYSCGASLHMPDFKGPLEDFCKYCVDERGDLKPREEVRQGIARFLQSWQPGVSDDEALTRAGFYMKAMPAWAA